MSSGWPAADLAKIDSADELTIATRRQDGTFRPSVPIWAVTVDGNVYVRTWHRRDTGWFGHAVRDGVARISVPGLSADVTVEDVGCHLRAEVDAAYRAKYDRYGVATVERMVGDEAASTTLRLAAN